MAKIQVKKENSARLRSEPDISNNQNVVGSAPGLTIINNATLSEDGQWYEISSTFIHASTVNVLRPDVTDPSQPTNPSLVDLDPLKVPYRSQWDVDANNRTADCGQTCVAMLAQWKGVSARINDLRFQSQPSGLSTSQNLVDNLKSLGLTAAYRLIDPVPASDGLMIPEILEQDLPAICLVAYNGFSRTSVQDRKYTGWHWLVLLGYDSLSKSVIVNDPDFWPPLREEGKKKRYSYEEWNRAFIPYPNSGNKLQYVYIPK